jgi:hypothetical protein
MADFVLRGCPYPIVKSPHGYLHTQTGVEQIKSDLLSLLLTNPKERVMHPEFGCNLRSLFFEPADAILAKKAEDLIIKAVQKWEPRVAFQQIKATVDEESNMLSIRIAFRDPQNIRDIEVLTLELPLGEGARTS